MEKWKAVLGFEGFYEVSDCGHVRSVDRIRRFVRGGRVVKARHRGRVLLPGLDTSGYFMVNLYDDERRKCALVHRLVLSAFDRPPEPGEEGRHLDGVRTNNVLSNLAWGTAADNTADKMRHGTAWVPLGEAHGRSKLAAKDVRAIRAVGGTETQAALARQFGISQAYVGRLLQHKTWAWLS